MAIYHLSAKIIGRSKGKSAVAAAAYRASQSLYSEHQDIQFDYSKKRGVEFSEILLPDHAPAWMQDRGKLWNAVEIFETRKDATYAREIEVALPVELSIEQQKELLREYIQDNFLKLGMVADYSIHDVNSHNPHAHIMLTLRHIVKGSFDKKERAWNDKRLFAQWREEWAVLTNKHLALNGTDKKISHLSYAARGIDLEPTMHRGYQNHLTPESKIILDRFQQAKAIKERNYERLIKNPEIALELLTNHESVFSHQDLARFVNERTESVEEFNNLKMAIESCSELVDLGKGLDNKYYYTSQKVLQQEQDLIACATRISKANAHQLNPKKFAFVAELYSLNDEQKSAFDYILSGNDLSLVVGFAGTGKSYLMDAVREAYETKGYRVVGTALAGKASDGLQQSANIESKTIARFMIDWENGREQLTDKTVIVIDEAGMIGTRQFHILLTEAERSGAKVIVCGDPEQLPPIEAGGAFRFLLERTKHVFLKNVIRQHEDWQRQATVELSTHQHAKALDRYKDHGFIHEHDIRDNAMGSIVDRWFAYNQENPQKSAVMMAYRRVDVLTLNLMAREKIFAKQIESSHLIETETFGKLPIAVGERIMFLRNEKSIKVKNGMLGTIEAIEQTRLTVALDQGHTITFDTKDYKDIGYGYAATIHKLQGVTVDKSFVLATRHFDRFLTNVALDRHRDNVELHYAKEDFASYDNFKRVLCRGDSKILGVEFAQARGFDYELALDDAANTQAEKDFSVYHEEIIAESIPIKNTLAEIYLKKLGIENIETNNVRFHPKVWERETQSFMPALVANAVGKSKDGVEIKGVQVTFLNEKGDKAGLKFATRYTGSPDAIIMLQKPAEKDNRWFVAADLETALQVAKAKPDVRVACLAVTGRLDEISLQGLDKELIFCTNKSTSRTVISRVAKAFARKEFKVSINKIALIKNHQSIDSKGLVFERNSEPEQEI